MRGTRERAPRREARWPNDGHAPTYVRAQVVDDAPDCPNEDRAQIAHQWCASRDGDESCDESIARCLKAPDGRGHRARLAAAASGDERSERARAPSQRRAHGGAGREGGGAGGGQALYRSDVEAHP